MSTWTIGIWRAECSTESAHESVRGVKCFGVISQRHVCNGGGDHNVSAKTWATLDSLYDEARSCGAA